MSVNPLRWWDVRPEDPDVDHKVATWWWDTRWSRPRRNWSAGVAHVRPLLSLLDDPDALEECEANWQCRECAAARWPCVCTAVTEPAYRWRPGDPIARFTTPAPEGTPA